MDFPKTSNKARCVQVVWSFAGSANKVKECML